MTHPHIPFFDYPAVFLSRKKEYLSVMTNVMERGAFILQSDLEDFEKNLATFTGVKYAFGVADGTAAITLGLRASGINPGDEIIIPSHTFIATASAIHFADAVPVLADCGRDHMLDPNDIENRITDRTRAICPVQLNGRTCDMDKILEIAKKHGLIIIEDAAQALGSKFRGKCAGTFGSAGTISFLPGKDFGFVWRWGCHSHKR